MLNFAIFFQTSVWILGFLFWCWVMSLWPW